MGRDGCYECCKSGHMKKDCLKAKDNIRECMKFATSGVNDETQKRNRFFDLQSKNKK